LNEKNNSFEEKSGFFAWKCQFSPVAFPLLVKSNFHWQFTNF